MSNATAVTLLIAVVIALAVVSFGWYRAEQRHRKRNRDLLTTLRAAQIATSGHEQQLIELQENHDGNVRELYRARADAADAESRAEEARQLLRRYRSTTSL